MKEIIKIADIFFITAIEIITAFGITLGLDKYIFRESHKRDDSKDTILLLIEVCLFAGVLGVTTYVIGKGIRRIPFPLDGWYGYKHLQYDELKGLTILSVFTLIFCDSIHYKLETLRKRNNFLY